MPTDDRTGLSSAGEARLVALEDQVAGLVRHLVDDEAAFNQAVVDAQNARLETASGPVAPVSQVDVDALTAQVRDLQERLARQQGQARPGDGALDAARAASGPGGEGAPVSLPSSPPEPFPPSYPFEGQTPMVTHPGPAAGPPPSPPGSLPPAQPPSGDR